MNPFFSVTMFVCVTLSSCEMQFNASPTLEVKKLNPLFCDTTDRKKNSKNVSFK